MTFDTIVVGLGGHGSAAAAHLAQRGQRVLGLERFGIAHDRGSSHGQSRVIRQAYFEDPAYVPLLLRAYELWRTLERETATTLLTVTGGLMAGPADSFVVQGSLRSAREHGLAHEMLDAAAIRRRFPPFQPTDDLAALYETQAGIVRPEAGVRAHLSRAQAAGARLRFDEPVRGWDAVANDVTVVTDQGRYTARRLVLAPGPWAPELFQIAIPLKVTRQVLYWFDPLGGIEAFLPERFPVYIWELPGGNEFYGFPAQPEPGAPAGVKVAFFYRDDPVVPDQPRSSVDASEVEAMRDALRGRIPSLAGPLIDARTCLYTETPDRHFVLGPHPHHENVFIASPCSGHGYKFCSVIGEILADLAIDGETRHPIALFRPNRFGGA
jgi:sarcosine oxidase